MAPAHAPSCGWLVSETATGHASIGMSLSMNVVPPERAEVPWPSDADF
jgi:hypothetical protein